MGMFMPHAYGPICWSSLLMTHGARVQSSVLWKWHRGGRSCPQCYLKLLLQSCICLLIVGCCLSLTWPGLSSSGSFHADTLCGLQGPLYRHQRVLFSKLGFFRAAVFRFFGCTMVAYWRYILGSAAGLHWTHADMTVARFSVTCKYLLRRMVSSPTNSGNGVGQSCRQIGLWTAEASRTPWPDASLTWIARLSSAMSSLFCFFLAQVKRLLWH
mmetsp:Transcript_5687/g.16771  ORF Transcript_5687/g.16771 Transcript_5687/m.16771 type:complete len:213 (-) Transcript_5687:319-957(-)